MEVLATCLELTGALTWTEEISQHFQSCSQVLLKNLSWSFKRQPYKMVKHTQTIRWQQPKNCLNVFEHFVGLALKGLKEIFKDGHLINRNVFLQWQWFSCLQHGHFHKSVKVIKLVSSLISHLLKLETLHSCYLIQSLFNCFKRHFFTLERKLDGYL